jgi:TatD DNase family protein
MISLMDTHAHLCDSQFDPDRTAAMERAKRAGVDTLIEIAEAPRGWERAKVFAGQNPNIWWACGFHPHYAKLISKFDFDIMKKAAQDSHCLAIGEIGLDYFKSTASKETQISLFRKTLEISAELNKPVVIHCREAQQDMLRILKSFFGGLARRDGVTGVIHCFSGDVSFAQGCLDLGFFLGVDGPITYPNSHLLREVISQVPLDRIVLETDCPYLPPQGFRGKRNEPSYLPLVAEKLVEIFGKSVEEIAQMTTQNAKKLFRM